MQHTLKTPAIEWPDNVVRAELAMVLQSPSFVSAPSHQRLLQHLVEHRLKGGSAAPKEAVLGIEVFQRSATSFDPAQDSIVRVEARRLRQRLARHYSAEGRRAELRIELPKGGYQALFVRQRLPASGAHAQAQELVQRGQFFLREGHEEGHRKALDRFEAAVRSDPHMAAAQVGVAQAWLQLVSTNIEPPRPGVDHAMTAARAALALEPRQAEALVLCAQLEQRFRFDWPAASALFGKALQASPESAYVRHAHAFGLMLRREFGPAEAELAVARRLDPLHLRLRAHEALLHLYRRDWDAALSTLAALLDLSPGNVLGLSLRANVELLRGHAAEALELYSEVKRLHPRLSVGRMGVALALLSQGRSMEADMEVESLVRDWRGHYLSPYQLAMVASKRGDIAQVLDLLHRAVDECDPNAVCLPVDPCFDPVRSDPRWLVLEQRVLGGAAPV